VPPESSSGGNWRAADETAKLNGTECIQQGGYVLENTGDKAKRNLTSSRPDPIPSGKGDGIFPSLVDRAAFFDKLVLSIRGRKRDSFGNAVRDPVNRPIGGTGRKYGRSENGVIAATGNSFELKYGPMRRQKFLPPMILTLRSDRTPLSRENTVAAINALCEGGWMASLSEVEVTFDLSGLSVEFFKRSILTSARQFRTLRDEKGRRTHYVGGRTSPWQLRIYDKTPSLVRFEFVARRAFLREHRIETPAHLRLFRDIDLRQRFQLRELDKDQMKALEQSIGEDVRRRVLARWNRDLPLRIFLPAVKKSFAAVPDELVVPSPVEERLRCMQWRLML
jgi:hypothetical protein